jgi:pimeloyl-ACP methyl ester carboxylesterase
LVKEADVLVDGPATTAASKIDVGAGTRLAVWRWSGTKTPRFILVHGLASNARTWDGVASRLSAAGYSLVSLDLRGHGRSDRPQSGYDLVTMASDVVSVIEATGGGPVVLAGQSYGGNLALEVARARSELLSGLVLVDGGFIDLHTRYRGDWRACLRQLTPPSLAGLPASEVQESALLQYPGWPPAAIQAQLANLEEDGSGGLRRRLALDHHLEILKSMFDQRPVELGSDIQLPVLVLAAQNPDQETGHVDALVHALPNGRLRWMPGHHDLHVEHPAAVTDQILQAIVDGFLHS